ncbi:MAG: hypothetical protein HY918_04665 [Candidatus Doudnabacteria bacterium]|nr:hypothetical protein [Candidatus Doudnabacteria bacterium]
MKDQEEIQNLFEDKYEEALGLSYNDWLEKGPQTQEEAYARCIAIDKELEASYEQWYEANGETKEHLGEHRDKLKAEYDLIEDVFGLEAQDKNF